MVQSLLHPVKHKKQQCHLLQHKYTAQLLTTTITVLGQYSFPSYSRYDITFK